MTRYATVSQSFSAPEWPLRKGKAVAMTPRERGRVNEQPLPSCTIGFIGFPSPLPVKTRGVIERCGIQPIELAGLDIACRILSSLDMCAIVIDTHRRDLTNVNESLVRFLEASRTVETRIALIVLTSTRLPADTRCRYLEAGATFVSSREQSRRHLAAVARRACGLPPGCCEPGGLRAAQTAS